MGEMGWGTVRTERVRPPAGRPAAAWSPGAWEPQGRQGGDGLFVNPDPRQARAPEEGR